LPLDITAKDGARAVEGDYWAGACDPIEHAAELMQDWLDRIDERPTMSGTIINNVFSDVSGVYIEMAVEKVDLRNLFARVCEANQVPILNARGWSDLHTRADILARFNEAHDNGQRCVLLYCGDHDPAGLNISDSLPKNLEALELTTGLSSSHIEVVRFGLNADFINANNITWTENLITSGGRCLSKPEKGKKITKRTRDYIAEFGVRKVEANVLVTRPEQGRQLCADAIGQYLTEEHKTECRRLNAEVTAEAQAELDRLLEEYDSE